MVFIQEGFKCIRIRSMDVVEAIVMEVELDKE